MLDAQFAGVPQRRRRVFVVGHFGDWRPPAAVLLEPESLRGDPPPRRAAGKAAPTIPARRTAGGGLGTDFDCDGGLIAHSLRADGFDASEDGTGRGTPLVALALTAREGKGPDSDATTTLIVSDPISANEGRTYSHEGRNNFRLHNVIPFDENQITSPENRPRPEPGDPAPTMAKYGRPVSVAFNLRGRDGGAQAEVDPDDLASIRSSNGGSSRSYVAPSASVRRLTPRECERLQGFPDDWTLVPYNGKPAADGPRYRAIGNSMPVPVMRWIGERIALCESVLSSREAAA